MHHFFKTVTIIAIFNPIFAMQQAKKLPQISQELFAQKSNAHLYGQALIAMDGNQKNEAIKIVEAIKRNQSLQAPATQLNTIQTLFDKVLLLYLLNDPQLLSELGLLESIGITEHNQELNDISLEKKLDLISQKKELLAQFKKFDVQLLSEDQRLTCKIFIDKLQHDIDEEPFVLHQYTATHWLDSNLQRLNMLFTHFHIINTPQDVENYLIRLNKLSPMVEQIIERIELQKKYGIISPRFSIEKVINLIETLITEDVTANIYYTYLKTKMNERAIVDKEILLQRAHNILSLAVYPAYKKLQNYLKNLLEKAQNHGLWALPQGDAYYAYLLKENTTTNLSSDEIHALGLKEIDLMQQEIRKILETQGIVDPTVDLSSLLKKFAPEQKLYENSEQGRQQCLADYYAILERSRKELGHLFEIKPKNELHIKRMPAHEEGGGLCAYYSWPSVDGTRQGIFYVNLKNAHSNKNFGMETLTIHEGEPGHHLQLSLQFETNIPLLRKTAFYLGYIEGWGLYCERLAYEHNFYSSAASKIAALQLELFRAARLVVDTGIHAKKWTREQAVEYLEKMSGFNHELVIGEVDRYFVLPGQACSYKIGQLKILELRDRAQKALKEKFDIRKFHTAILKTGAVPLTILEEEVDKYIQNTLKSK